VLFYVVVAFTAVDPTTGHSPHSVDSNEVQVTIPATVTVAPATALTATVQWSSGLVVTGTGGTTFSSTMKQVSSTSSGIVGENDEEVLLLWDRPDKSAEAAEEREICLSSDDADIRPSDSEESWREIPAT
jgi:hypothetical protein